MSPFRTPAPPLAPAARRWLAVLLLAFVICGGHPLRPDAVRSALAQDGADDGDGADADPDAREPVCTCDLRNACYHYLNAPVEAPYGACYCEKCTREDPHAGNKTPRGMNPACFATKDMDCFLRRHTASWQAICSECLATTKCCNTAHPEQCPQCRKDDKDPWDARQRETLARQLDVERKVFTKRDPVVLIGKHFYIVTDVKRFKMRTQDNGFRYVDAHEYAHVLLIRAEQAYREFSRKFRGRLGQSRPMGLFVPESAGTAAKLQEEYFRNPRYPMIYSAYASASQSSISDGFVLNGLCVPPGKVSGEDHHLHEAVRHFIGHILISVWIKRDGDNRTLPRWVFVGAGHWLGKGLPELADKVYYCEGEDRKMGGSGKEWMKKCVKTAETDGFGPIEEFLSKSSLGALEWKDHLRAWGYFQVCMAEWRRPWVDMLSDLRRQVPVREAFEKNLKMSPEQFHERWLARVLERRISMDPAKDERDTAEGVATGPQRLAQETDPVALAAYLRSLGRVTDPEMARGLLDLIARWDDDLIRETVVVTLAKTEDAAALAAIAEHGLAHGHRRVRAYTARICRLLDLDGARDGLRALLDDPNWLVRAEAVLALGRIRDFDSQARMRAWVASEQPKVQIAAMDALTLFEEEVNPVCVPGLAANLDHHAWQVRLACVQALRDIGDHRSVGPLIDRMEIEGGRLREEIHEALKAITYDDLGKKPENWRKWWDRTHAGVERDGGFKDTGPKDPTMGGRYAAPDVPTYYGIELFSSRIGFVLDISRSTNRKFAASQSTLRLLPPELAADTVSDICKAEIVRSIRSLDPRAKFNVVAFGSDVFRWKRQLQPATPSNKKGAEGFVMGKSPLGETNVYEALRLSLGIDDADPHDLAFGDTPDTLTFLTDGSPTVGAIVDPDTLVVWFTEMNRYARVKTHVVAFGTLGVDEVLLQRLAGRNGGRFVQLIESAR